MDPRPLTPDERKTLSDLPSPHAPFHLLWDTAMGSFGATGCLGAIVTLAVVAWLGSIDAAPAIRTAALVSIVGMVFVVATISTWMRYSIARRKELHWRKQIDADLAAGVASVERHKVAAALRAILMDRRRAYFLRLEDGRVLFVGFWNPPEHDNPHAISGLPPDLPDYPASEVVIARGPATGIVVGVAFSGAPSTAEGTFEVRTTTAAPSVESGDIVPLPWEQIRKTYG